MRGEAPGREEGVGWAAAGPGNGAGGAGALDGTGVGGGGEEQCIVRAPSKHMLFNRIRAPAVVERGGASAPKL